MARRYNQETIKVATAPTPKGVRVGKPAKVITSAMRMKTGSLGVIGDTTIGSGGNFYSPELSPDFLELPQSIDEKRNFYRIFYRYEPFVGQAIDILTELPLSKVRFGMPEARNRELAKASMRFCQRWAKNIKLLQRLISILRELNLMGDAIIFCEDTSPDMPPEVTARQVREITADGQVVERWEDYEDKDERAHQWLKKNYKGWTAVRVLPPEQVRIESFPFTDLKLVELVIDDRTKAIIDRAWQGDPKAQRIVDSMPQEIVEAVREGRNATLNTDPDAGSFVFVLSRQKSDYEQYGQSVLERNMRTLIFRDKVRQSLTSIASRHMTPHRLVYAEDLSDDQTEALREQVDLALQDPDYSIITSFPVNWEEMGSDTRLPDWSWVYDLTDRQMYAGLGVTESLLSGESSYSGDRINLEVINTRFLLVRELLQDLVEDYFLKPMCRRMGFVEEDEDGNLEVIVPRLTFTRLALRDSSDTFDALFNLYNKGSLDIDVILELLNIDPIETNEKLKRDVFTLNDPLFNEILRGLYSRAGEELLEGTEVMERLAKELGLKYKKPDNEGRF